MLYLINTIESRKVEYMRTYNQLISLGVEPSNIQIDFGYTHEDINVEKSYHLIHYNFLERVLPIIINLNCDFVYLEDNVHPIKKVEDIDIDKNKINWLGYIWTQKDFTCGIKMVYIPIDICKDIYAKRLSFKPQFIDRLLRNYGVKNECLNIGLNYIKLYDPKKSRWGNENQKKLKCKRKEKLSISVSIM